MLCTVFTILLAILNNLQQLPINSNEHVRENIPSRVCTQNFQQTAHQLQGASTRGESREVSNRYISNLSHRPVGQNPRILPGGNNSKNPSPRSPKKQRSSANKTKTPSIFLALKKTTINRKKQKKKLNTQHHVAGRAGRGLRKRPLRIAHQREKKSRGKGLVAHRPLTTPHPLRAASLSSLSLSLALLQLYHTIIRGALSQLLLRIRTYSSSHAKRRSGSPRSLTL